MSLIEIVRLAGRGDGVTSDGRYIAYAAPGDTIADDGAVIAGPHHVAPACRHFRRCGGCQLQHVDDETYSDFIVDRISGALVAQKIDLPDIAVPALSPPFSRRRATLRAERQGRRILLGFNEGASHRIVDIGECPVLHPTLFALIAPLRALLGTLITERRQAEISMTLIDRGVDLAIGPVTADGLAAAEALTDFAAMHGLARLTIDDGYGPQTRWEPEGATITLGGVAVGFPPGAFLQATEAGEATLVEAVLGAVAGARTVADLFAGLGTFALPLAQTARVYAAEGARDAAASLKLGAARAQRQIAVEHRDLFRRPVEPADLGRFDAVVLDPPRAGAKEQAAALAAARGSLATIAYVSCNPATFARDARTLIDGGWRLEHILPVGQFRWSTHVELAARFRR